MPTKPLGDSEAFPIVAGAWAAEKGLLTPEGTLAVLKTSNNLSDIGNKSLARFNLGVGIGTDVQAYSSKLSLYSTGSNPSSFTLGLVGLTTAALWRSNLGAGTVSNLPTPIIDTLGTDIAVAVTSPTTEPQITLSIPTASATNRGALSKEDWATFNGKQNALTSGTTIKTVGGVNILGSGDIQSVSSVNVSGGTTGLTFIGGPITSSGTMTLSGSLALANGGTGGTDGPSARSGLGLGTLSTQNANAVTITGGTISINAGTAASPTLAFSGSSTSGLFRAGADVIGLSTAGVERLRVNATGNVGIGGVVDPSHLLTVTGAGTTTRIRLTDSDSVATGALALVEFGGSNGRSGFVGANDGVMMLFGESGMDASISTNGSERVRITAGGSVGIGSTSPKSALEISAAAPYLTWTETDQVTDSRCWRWGSANGSFYLQTMNDAANTANNAYVVARDGMNVIRHHWYTEGVERVRLANNGNLGIGTVATPGRLTIQQDGTSAECLVLVKGSDSAAFGAAIQGNRCRVSGDTPSPVVSQDVLTGIYGTGYHAGNTYSANVAAIRLIAIQDFAATAHGTYIDFAVTNDNTTSRSARYVMTFTAFRPFSDNSVSLGASGQRWTQLHSVTATINTSDARLKQDISDIPEEWLDAWGDVNWKRYKFIDAVQDKGENARWHLGLIAQEVRDAFSDRGLDALKIGLLCYDEIAEQPAILNDDGTIQQDVIPAYNVWGLRYTECFAINSAYQERELAREKAARQILENKMALLEARLEAAGL